MKLTDDAIVEALEQGKRIGREALYGTIYFYRSECGALVMRQRGGKIEALPYFIVADLKADDWGIVE